MPADKQSRAEDTAKMLYIFVFVLDLLFIKKSSIVVESLKFGIHAVLYKTLEHHL